MTMTVAVAPVIAAIIAAVVPSVIATLIASIVTPFLSALFAVEVTPLFATILVAVSATALLVARGIFLLIPVVLHEKDAFATGVIAMTVFSPVSRMPGWDAQIKWRAANRHAFNHHGLREKQRRRREAANIEATIKSGLANADRDLGGSRDARTQCGSG